MDLKRELILKRICGEIVLSNDPGKTIRKWRNIFKIPQRKLADEMGVTSSVISDYESGRRKNPGIKIINNIVEAMLRIDEKRGGEIIKEFLNLPSDPVLSEAIMDIKEMGKGISIRDFCKLIGAEIVVGKDMSDKNIYGYTVIDSIKAIVELSPRELVKLYGITTERALIFTKTTTGRSPMVAIKVTSLKPGLVVFHGPNKIDDLAQRIGAAEHIPLAICRLEVNEMLKRLREI